MTSNLLYKITSLKTTAGDKLQLISSGEVFDKRFGAGGGGTVLEFFGINDLNRSAGSSISGAQFPAIMLPHSPLQVGSNPRIQSFIRAF